MKRIFILLFLSFCFVPLYAGTMGKIVGKVIDKSTGNSLPLANVVIKETTMGAATNEAGEFFILNVPPGRYNIEARMMGYGAVTKKDVLVRSDYTTIVNFELESVAVRAEGIVVTAKRPPIQPDFVATSQYLEADLIERIPALSIKDILSSQAGILSDQTYKGVEIMDQAHEMQAVEQFYGNPDDRMHFRGGRSNETVYLLEGMQLNDPIWGGFLLDYFPENILEELTTYTGTFSAEYGGALSAVVNMVAHEPGKRFSFNYTGSTDKIVTDNENTHKHTFSLSTPLIRDKLSLFFAGKYFKSDGRFYGYIYPEWRNTEGEDRSGEPELIPIGYRDILSGLFKLNYKPTTTIKLSLIGLADSVQASQYYHYFKYNPYGAPRIWMTDRMGILKFAQLISERLFYTIGLSWYKKNYYNKIYDTAEEHMVEKHKVSPDGFSVSGTAFLWKKTQSTTREIKFDMVYQLSDFHEIKFGSDYRYCNLQLERRNPTAPSPEYRMVAWESYTRHPNKLSTYIHDKMEFRDIGMILSLGLRYDRIDPNTWWIKDIYHPTTSDIFKVKPKEYFSPRIGVSYPITDMAAFRFSYGVFYQFPHLYLLYQGLNVESEVYPRPSLRNIQTAVGNGDMKPEQVTSYEAGVQVAIREDLTFNAAAFYRDMVDLVGRQYVSIEGMSPYFMFDNKAFGTARGIEFILEKRLTRRLSGYINYTYTKVEMSHPDVLFFPTIEFHRPVTADWEQTHTISFVIDYNVPPNWGVTLSGYYNSGFPYTVVTEPNTERAPPLKGINLRIDKSLTLLGIRSTAFLEVFNLLNTKDIYWVYPATGKPDDDGNPATSPEHDANPTAFGPGRRIFLGISLSR